MSRKKQTELFDDHNWRNEWQNMPEFVQDKQEAYATIIIRFENEDHLNDFSKIIGQKLTKRTKSIWHPFKSHWGKPKKVWINEK